MNNLQFFRARFLVLEEVKKYDAFYLTIKIFSQCKHVM